MALINNINNIAVRIHGNRLGNAGFEPILTLNANSDFPQLTYDGCPGMMSNLYYFTLQISEKYTRYMLIHNNVRSFGASREGLLKMAIGIPRGYKLGNGKSPYDLLLAIRQYFVATFMDAGLNNTFNFKQEIDSEKLKQGVMEILSEYPLDIATNQPYRPMASSPERLAVLLANGDTMRLLFNDVQYSEFSPYTQIVVAERGDKSGYAMDLGGRIQIPRKPNLRLFFSNGENISIPSDGVVDISVTQILGLSLEAYEDCRLKFNVQEIISGKEVDVVSYNPQEERIDCDIRLKEKTQRILIKCTEDQSINYSNIKITLAGTTRRLNSNYSYIDLKGEQILKSRDCRVTYEGNGWQVVNPSPKLQEDIKGNKTYEIELTKVPPRMQASISKPSQTSSEPSKKPIIQLLPDLAFIANRKVGKKEDPSNPYPSSLEVRVRCDYGVLSVRPVMQMDKKERYYQIELPQEWARSSCEIKLPEEHLKYEGAVAGKGYKLSAFKSYRSKRKPKKIMLILVPVACLLIGLALGYFIGPKVFSKNEEKGNAAVTANNQQSSSDFIQDAVKKYNVYMDSMNNDDLTFNQVDNIDQWLSNLTDDQKGSLSDVDDFEKKVKVYKDVKAVILGKDDPDALRTKLNEIIGDYGETIMEPHLRFLRAAYKGICGEGNNCSEYKDYQKNAAKDLYKEKHGNFTSYKDVHDQISMKVKNVANSNRETSTEQGGTENVDKNPGV